ncbi:uncharacterized protein LOC135155983 [Lytechinus pictus]|uniref:uncharacterized protein LOC135155983 n=1 Tax=Lytechinus pictus TaxID=7653 RepID=UPI0030BA2255
MQPHVSPLQNILIILHLTCRRTLYILQLFFNEYWKHSKTSKGGVSPLNMSSSPWRIFHWSIYRFAAMFRFHHKENADSISQVLLLIIVLLSIGHQVKAVSYVEGQEAKLIFPYPCGSKDITLQQSNRLPFYNSADGATLSLPEEQCQRFNVEKKNNTDPCYLNLKINNLHRVDQGTYILFVYENQRLITDDTYKIWLDIDYPPGKASCVVDEDNGGKWVSVDCRAKTGSLPGKIECYQNGEWMPSLTEPIKTHITLKQTILIRKSQPAFCCSSILNGNKTRDECDDTALFQHDARSNDSSATVSMKTTTGSQLDMVGITKTYHSPNSHTISTIGINNGQDDLKTVITHMYSGLAAAVFLFLIMNGILLYMMRMMHKNIKGNQNPRREAILLDRVK